MNSAVTSSSGPANGRPHVPAPYGYSRRHRAFEVLCISAVLGLLVAFSVQVPRTIETAGGWVTLMLTGLVAYLASDVISGLVHWAGDTLGHERVWFLGPNFIRPFRQHHVDQKEITRHDFVETNGNNCIITCGPLALSFLFLPSTERFAFFAATFVAFLSFFVMATNQFHKWAHLDRPPGLPRWLQRWGLILTPTHHQVHHARPHDRQYCITVGWMNPLLNGLRFFRAAEWLVARFCPSWLHLPDRLPPSGGSVAPATGTPSSPMCNRGEHIVSRGDRC